jgi:hypothetical protein
MIGLGGTKRQESIGLVLEFNGSASETDVLAEQNPVGNETWVLEGVWVKQRRANGCSRVLSVTPGVFGHSPIVHKREIHQVVVLF